MYGKCTVWIQQEPVPVPVRPLRCMVYSHNMYGCNRIRVRWPALGIWVMVSAIIWIANYDWPKKFKFSMIGLSKYDYNMILSIIYCICIVIIL